MIKTYFTSKSVVFKWLLSYLLILLIPLLATCIAYVSAYQVIQSQIIRTNNILLNEIKENTDDILKETYRLINVMSVDAQVDNIACKSGMTKDSDYYDIWLASESMKQYNLFNSSIDHYFIYLKNINMVLSTENCLDSKSYYDIYYSKSGMTYEEWLKILNSNSKGSYLFWKENYSKDSFLVYQCSVPISNLGTGNGNIFVFIDKAKMLQYNPSLNSVNQGYKFILGQNLVITALPDLAVDDKLRAKLNQDSDMIHTVVNGESVVVSYTSSQINEWKYVSIIPASLFWEKLKRLQILMVVCFVLCLLFGGTLSWVMTKKNYSPVKKLVSLINNRVSRLPGTQHNEFAVIENAVISTMSENNKITRMMYQQKKTLQSDFLARVAKGNFKSPKLLDQYLKKLDIHFEYDRFAIILFYLDDEKEDLIQNENINLVKLIMENIFRDVFNPYYKGYLIEVDEMISYVVNIGVFENESADTALNELKSRTELAIEFISQTYNTFLSVSLSNIHSTIYGLRDAYSEAQQTLEYQLAMDEKEILCYKELDGLLENECYYPLEQEQLLINFIKVGNNSKAIGIFNELLEENFEKRLPTTQIKKWFAYNFMCTIMRIINNIKAVYSNDLTYLIPQVENLINCEDIQNMKETAISIMETLCEKIKNEIGNPQIIDKIINCIQLSYSDENLNVSSIAEKIDMNSIYISQVFKEKTGEGILDYLHRVRVNASKKLIQEQPDMSLDDIAYETGFSNTRTFTRVFKNQEGITPSKYKGFFNI